MKSFPVLLAVLSLLICARAMAEEAPEPPIRVQCTPSLVPFAKTLVRPLREAGIEIKLIQEAGNTQVIADLGADEIDAALVTRPLTVDERVGYPERHFSATTLGLQAVAVVVSRAVWDSGVHALKRDQIADAYENKAHNWKELGGEDRPLQFFEPAHGRGSWEIFATWLYGDTRKAPGVNWQVVADGSDTQTTLQFASGAISVAGFRWVDRRDVFALSLIDDSGKAIDPTLENVASGAYPLTRPVVIVFGKEPAAQKRKLLEFLTGEKGQELLKAQDYLPQAVGK